MAVTGIISMGRLPLFYFPKSNISFVIPSPPPETIIPGLL
jgi:hypothetical protein